MNLYHFVYIENIHHRRLLVCQHFGGSPIRYAADRNPFATKEKT